MWLMPLYKKPEPPPIKYIEKKFAVNPHFSKTIQCIEMTTSEIF